MSWSKSSGFSNYFGNIGKTEKHMYKQITGRYSKASDEYANFKHKHERNTLTFSQKGKFVTQKNKRDQARIKDFFQGGTCTLVSAPERNVDGQRSKVVKLP